MEKRKLYPIQKLSCFPENGIYSPGLAGAVRIEGKIDKKKLEEVINNIVLNNDAFSFRFEYNENDNEIYQYTVENTGYTLDARKAVGNTDEERLQDVRDQISEVRRFSVENNFKGAIPWNFILFDMGDDDHILYVRVIHLISDGMSMGILMKSIVSGYNGMPLAEAVGVTKFIEDFDEMVNSGELAAQLEKYDDLIKGHIAYKPFLKIPEYDERNYAKYGEFVTLKKEKLDEVCRKNRLSFFHVTLIMAHTMFSLLHGRNETRLTIPVGTRKKKYMATIGLLSEMYFSRIELDDSKTMLENALTCRDLNLREVRTSPIMPYVITENALPIECVISYQSYITNINEVIPFGEAKAKTFSDMALMDYYYSNFLCISAVETDTEIRLTLRNDGMLMNSEQAAEGVKIFNAVYDCLTKQDMTFGEFKKQFDK